MRKILTIILVFSMISTTVFAVPNVTTKDSENNIINISDTSVKSGKVMLTVFNPGFDETFIASDADAAIQYFASAQSSDNGYSFDIKMNVLSDGGSYRAVVTSNGQKEQLSFSFYPYETKLRLIAEINSAHSASELTLSNTVDMLLKSYNLDNFGMATSVSKEELARILINEKGSGYSLDTDKMYKTLKETINLAALNLSSAEAFSGNTFKYPELLLGDDISFKQAYENINAQGIIYIKNALSGKGFARNSDAQSVLKSQIILHLIQNNKSLGSGHVADVITGFSSYLISQGFSVSKHSSIKNKSAFYDYLVSSNVSGLSALKQRFNSYSEEDTANTQGTATGPVSGSVSSNSGTAQTYIPPENKTVFSDVTDKHWAKEPIEKLSSLGIINGKGNSSFDPDGNVTRAEFTKMVIVAAGLMTNNADCTFDDVLSHWSKDYVAASFSNGIVSGVSDDMFSPDSFISREQGATIIYRAAIKAGAAFDGNSSAFNDENEISSWAKDAVSALSAKGIINGRDGGIFAPSHNLTRAEAAKIIYYSLEILNSK